MTQKVPTAICPINGKPARFYCRKGRAEYFIEPTSGTIFQAKMPSVPEMGAYAEQEYASGAYREYAKSRDFKIKTARERLAKIRTLTTGRRLLDVGCATGFFLEAATETGFEGHGLEFSTVAISLARPDIRDRITCGDVNTLLRQDSRKFDVVTAFDIIEHVQNPAAFLEEIRSILAPGGIIALSTPDTGHPLRYLMGRSWPMLQPLQHTVLFSKSSMTDLLKARGYTDIEVSAAGKVLSMDYLGDQLAATNPGLHALYRRLHRLVPGPLRRRAFSVNIGELEAYARAAP